MGKNWAITIGINRYSNLQALQFAKRDAELVREYFHDEIEFEKIYHFTDDSPPIPQDHGPDLDSRPTFATIKRFLRVRFDHKFLRTGDNLWFFFAGHGVHHEDRDYLMPLDADPGDIKSTAIPLNYVTERLRRSGADNVILLVDACRSRTRAGLGVGEEQQKGVITLFACSPKETSYEIEDSNVQQGAFTYVLLQGLRVQGAGNCATVERLDHYLRNEVPKLNQHYRKPIQTPYCKVEPLAKSHLILLPKQATLSDIKALKFEASQAEIRLEYHLAKQLWIRVLSASSTDSDAIEGIERLAQVEARKRQRTEEEITTTSLARFSGLRSKSYSKVLRLNQSKIGIGSLSSMHSKSVTALAVSLDGKILISGGGDGDLRVWETASGKLIRTLSEHKNSISSVAINSKLDYFASGSSDHRVAIWDFSNFRNLKNFSHPNAITALAFVPGEETLYTACSDGVIRCFNNDSNNTIEFDKNSPFPSSLVITSKGDKIISGHGNQKVIIWPDFEITDCKRSISSLAVSEDDTYLAVGSHNDSGGEIIIWDLEQKKEIRRIDGHDGSISSLIISPNNDFVISSSYEDVSIKIWDMWTGNEIDSMSAHTKCINALAMTSNGQILYSGSKDCSIKKWEIVQL